MKPQRYYYCGCCDHYHRQDYMGDCRNDKERFTLEELEAQGVDIENVAEFESEQKG